MTSSSQNNGSPHSTKNTGKWGELVAKEYLISQGYGIVELGWRSGHYEVDIVAQKGTRIVFVEVKTRRSASIDPIKAVTPAKMRRIIRSADVYLRTKNIPLEYQFDIVTITGDKAKYKIEHIPDAYYPSVKLR